MSYEIAAIESIEDPQLDPYRELKKTNYTRWSNYFIAEGKWVVQRLLQSDFELNSVLVARSKLQAFVETVDRAGRLSILSVPDSVVHQLVRFEFHAGIMACGVRRKQTTLEDHHLKQGSEEANTFLACPETTLPDNLGSMIRLAAGFGCNGVIVGRGSADPFCRRTIRVSMGNIFSIPIIEPDDISDMLQRLRNDHAFDVVATSLDPDSEELESCSQRRRNTCLVFGNEAHGLRPEHYASANRKVMLPMNGEIDSLNVSHSAAIFLYHFSRIAVIRA